MGTTKGKSKAKRGTTKAKREKRRRDTWRETAVGAIRLAELALADYRPRPLVQSFLEAARIALDELKAIDEAAEAA